MCSAVVRALASARFWGGFLPILGFAGASQGSTVGQLVVVGPVVVVASTVVTPVVVVVVVVVGEVVPGLGMREPCVIVAGRRVANAAVGAGLCAMWLFAVVTSLRQLQSARTCWPPPAFGPVAAAPSGWVLPR